MQKRDSRYPLISVIVLNYNGAGLLSECLGSLVTQSYPNLEIIVADNGSNDNSREAVSNYGGVKFLALGKNYGFSKGNNLAAEGARGKYIFFVNNDMRFEKDCVHQLFNIIEGNENIFSVDAKQYNWEGTRIIHGRTVLVKSGRFFRSFLPFLDIVYTAQSDSSVSIPHGCAGNLMVRKELFEKLSGFDETFFIDCEDLDLCWRAWGRRWETLYVPAASVYHKCGRAFDTEALRLKRRKSNIRNQLYFALKVLPWNMVFLIISRQCIRIFYYLFIRFDLKEANVIFMGCGMAVLNFKKALKERKKNEKESIIGSSDILKQFIVRGNCE